ncbi:MAG: proline--tRNA ligase [Bacteroidia bacterium]|nr:proline--tRNA ligase [Bacteroidia bacterium]
MGFEKIKRSEDYSAWYNNLVKEADMAEHAAVKGCMVIKPYGYSIWERMQQKLDKMFKDTGHVNAYFPLLIPKSFLSKEADHVEGFAKECAVVTHYRLKNDEHGKGVIVDPEAKLDEELIIRPTSETVIWNTYRDWIQSYRDLPLLINQWANVMRWEMRTRLFLRTSEFLWQEGHTAHASREEAEAEAKQMLDVYADFAENFLGVPVIKGVKTANERFAGAVETYCIEGLMQDGKALQMGTSHFLGQNFAKAFDVKFQNKEGKLDYVWATSWGVSTRLIGALIMVHSDDDGLILPPNLAPIQVVLVPIYKTDQEHESIVGYLHSLKSELDKADVRVKIDDRDTLKPGYKFAEWEHKGVPLRIAVGPRDMENHTVELARRDIKTKESAPQSGLVDLVKSLLPQIQSSLYNIAKEFRDSRITRVESWEEFEHALDNTPGFISAHWDGTSATEQAIKEKTKATIRCIPLNNPQEEGKCVFSGRPSKERVLFARAY